MKPWEDVGGLNRLRSRVGAEEERVQISGFRGGKGSSADLMREEDRREALEIPGAITGDCRLMM